MSYRGVAGFARAGSALGLLLIIGTQAQAGGFAIREQSAYGQGASFAGMAAGGALSSMYWNPATITQHEGKNVESDLSVILPKASHSYTTSTVATTLGGVTPAYRNGYDNSGNNELVPSMYASWQFSRQLWFGLSVNAPFGLGVNFPQAWAGARYGQDSSLRTYNVAPTIAYKFNDMISVAAGVQVQYASVYYAGAVPGAGMSYLAGKGYAFGYTLGATITPTPTTKIGIGYRSALNQKINGDKSGLTSGSIYTTLNLPDLLSVGLRQQIGDRFILLAGAEWQNWSRIGTATVHNGDGTVATTLPFQYSNGSFYSLGGEYIVDPSFTVRAGIAFEKSPITDGVRTPRLPDNDRMWYSIGGTYKHPTIRGLIFDLGYSYIDVKDTPIDISAASGNPWFVTAPGVGGTYIGSVSSHIHILSFGLRYQWGAEPAHTTALITK